MATPLTDKINALTSASNETTGASDTTLGDAVATLIAGYGGDDGMFTLLASGELESANNALLNISSLNVTEIYCYLYYGVTESGNTTVLINGVEASFLSEPPTSLKYAEFHCLKLGDYIWFDNLPAYATLGYPTSIKGAWARGTNHFDTYDYIESIKLVRNASANTFLAGSAFAIYGK